MTFDELIEKILNNEDYNAYGLSVDDVITLIEVLRLEYAPTVEMTKGQYAFITSEYERENVVDAVANLTVDDFLRENFDAKFWEPLTQREVVQAWLHPETVKLVDYEI